MVAKTLEVQAATGQSSMTASAYPIGTDTVAAQVSAAALTEATNRLGWYTCTADDLAAGDYQIKVLDSGGGLAASWMARIEAGAATYQCHESLPDTMSAGQKAEILVEVNSAIDTAISELGVGAPTATPTIRTALMLLYMSLRNKTVTQTSGTDALEVYNDAGTIIAKKLLTDDGDDYTAAEMVSG